MGGDVHVTLYAAARQAFGAGTTRIEVPSEGLIVQDLLDLLARRSPALGRLLPTCRFVVNGEYARGRRVRVHAGDEFGVHPPYSGG